MGNMMLGFIAKLDHRMRGLREDNPTHPLYVSWRLVVLFGQIALWLAAVIYEIITTVLAIPLMLLLGLFFLVCYMARFYSFAEEAFCKPLWWWVRKQINRDLNNSRTTVDR